MGQKSNRCLRSLAVVPGMKKTNDQSEQTKADC